MPSLRCVGLAFAHLDAVPLFSDVDLHLGPGWHGLVGENGAGKSTLLRLVAGALAPDRGHVRLLPAGARVVLCPQEVEALEAEVEALGRDDGGEARALRARLGLDPATLARWATLSPGERKRWQIGAALAGEPAVLLLDEPTNHLDAAGRVLLLGALRAFSGIGLVVSHDRALLDGLTTRTLRLSGGVVRLFEGSYAAAARLWAAEEEAARAERERQRGAQRRAERQLDEARRAHEAARRSTSARHRMKDRHDSDARGIGAQVRADWAEARAGRGVAVARARAERAAAAVAPVAVEDPLGRAVALGYERAPRPVLVTLEARPLAAGARLIAEDLRVALRREDRIELRGDNGAGKSTLVRALLARWDLPREKLLYLPQELAAAERDALVRETLALAPEARGRALSLLAALGVDPARLLAARRASPGEARKLALALGLARRVWLAVLDEPTNHLDLPSIERIEAALGHFPGALLLVTHDPALARRCTTTSWTIASGRLDVATV